MSKISFQDMSYIDKRKIMRQKAYKDIDIQEIISYVVYHSHECSMPFNMDKEQMLKSLLVDGYIAFEKIYDKSQNNLIDYQAIDPETLQLQFDGSWIQYPDHPLNRNLFKSQVLYLSYGSDWVTNYSTSLVEQIIVGGLTMKNIALINIIADDSYRILKNFDKKLERRAKLERILDGC